MPQTLSLGLWNARGISGHVEELKLFLTEHNIDIMLITESWLQENIQIYFPGYNIHKADHPSNRLRGGAAILVKEEISHFPCDPVTTTQLQMASIKIVTTSGELAISSLYLPPKIPWTEADFNQILNDLGSKFIIGGDFNAKSRLWGSFRGDVRGRCLQQAVQSSSAQILATGHATHYPADTNRTPSHIDLFVYNGLRPENFMIRTEYQLSSDHLPIVVTYDTVPVITTKMSRLLPSGANLDVFRLELEKTLDLNLEILLPEDIEDAHAIFLNKTHSAALCAAPAHQLHSSQNSLPRSIETLLLIKRRLRRQHCRTRDPIVYRVYQRVSNRVKKLLVLHKQMQNDRLLSNASTDSSPKHSLWTLAKKYKQQVVPKFPIKKPDGSWARSPKERAEAFAEDLEARFQPFNTSSTSCQRKVQLTLESPEQLCPPVAPITVEEVHGHIKQLKARKAPGEDGLDNFTLKAMPLKAVIFLVLLFNSVLRLGHVPKLWKKARICMIHKPGKSPSSLDSYRPISLLPTIAKLFERCLLTRLLQLESIKEKIPPFQFGFRKSHGTPEQLNRVVNFILEGFEEKEYVVAAYLDIAQAFDRVWHNGLLAKIKPLLPPQLLWIIRSYLADRTFTVVLDGAESSVRTIQAGVPQGSVLGPTLYTLFTHDMPTGSTIPIDDTNDLLIATYADDTAILARSSRITEATEVLQLYLHSFEAWAKRWNIGINTSKCANVTYALRVSLCSGVYLQGQRLEHLSSYKYLGVHLDHHLTFAKHVSSIIGTLKNRIKRIRWLLSNKWLSLDNKVKLYKTCITPSWRYGLQVYGITAKTHLGKIRILQAKTLRLISAAPWYVRTANIENDLRVPKIGDVLQKQTTQYIQRLENHKNPLARRLLNVRNIRGRPMRRRLKRNHPIDLATRQLC